MVHVHVVLTPDQSHGVTEVLLIERVRRVRGRPGHAPVRHEDARHHPHAAIRNHRAAGVVVIDRDAIDRKSTRLNSSHGYISYAVFCLKKKKIKKSYE